MRLPGREKSFPGSAFLFLCVLCAFLSAMFPFESGATEEAIFGYDVDVLVRRDSSVRVVETMIFDAHHKKIRRGLYRDVSPEYVGENGRKVRGEMEIVGVELNGEPSRYTVEYIGDVVRINLGHETNYLPKGRNTFVLTYLMTDQVDFRDGFDELYWNATGNDWEFPILDASFRLKVEGFEGEFSAVDFYTGKTGERRGRNATYSNGVIRSTQGIFPGEGLTVSFAWPKGYVERTGTALRNPLRVPSFLERSASNIFAALFVPLISVLVFLTLWFMVGRDPDMISIFPRFSLDMSPGLAFYIADMGLGETSLVSEILNLAVNGYVVFEDTLPDIVTGTRNIVVVRTAKDAAEDSFEGMLLRRIFEKSDRVEIHKDNESVFSEVRKWLKKRYASETAHLFSHNHGFFLVGLAASTAVFLVFHGVRLEYCSISLIVLVAYTLIAAAVSGIWMDVNRTGRDISEYVAEAVVMVAVGLLGIFGPYYLGFARVVREAMSAQVMAYIVSLVLTLVVATAFYFLMKVRSVEGIGVLAEIQGFAMYLGTAEVHMLKRFNPPEETMRTFEKFLPFAIALGLMDNWSNRFTQQMGKTEYRPAWRRDGISSGTRTFTASLAESLSSCSSSSRFGRGRGGSSGGGRGGRGGGGR